MSQSIIKFTHQSKWFLNDSENHIYCFINTLVVSTILNLHIYNAYLYTYYLLQLPPGLQDYKINIYVKKTPLVTISTSKALLHLYSTMEVVASSPDSEPSLLFVIDLVSSLFRFKIVNEVSKKCLRHQNTQCD